MEAATGTYVILGLLSYLGLPGFLLTRSMRNKEQPVQKKSAFEMARQVKAEIRAETMKA